MGYMRHNALVVSGSYSNYINLAHARALELGMAVSGIVDSPSNGVKSFFIAPDGSKEGWDNSERGDECRQAFVGWLATQRYGDGSGPLDWVEIQYGDDERKTRVIAHSDQAAYRVAGKLA